MAPRFSATATAAAIGLVGTALAAAPAGAAKAADCAAAHGVKPAMVGGVLDGITDVSPEELSGLVNPLWTLQDAAGHHVGRQFAVEYDPAAVSGEIQLGVPAAGWSAAYSTGPGTIVTVSDAPSTTASGTLIGLPAFARGPIRFDLEAGTVGFPVTGVGAAAPAQVQVPAPAAPQQRIVVPAVAPPPADPAAQQPAAPAHTAPVKPAPHETGTPNRPTQPFHKTGKKARSLPDTGLPLSAALGAVTALTALLAGIGTVLAARRRTDHEARR